MAATVIAICAVVGVFVNFAMLLMHCRKDKREFRELGKKPELDR